MVVAALMGRGGSEDVWLQATSGSLGHLLCQTAHGRSGTGN